MASSNQALSDDWVSISPREAPSPQRVRRNPVFGTATASLKFKSCIMLAETEKKWEALLGQIDDPNRQARIASQISGLKHLKTCLEASAPVTVNLAQNLPSFQEFVTAAKQEQVDDPQDFIKLMKIQIALLTSMRLLCIEKNLDGQAKTLAVHIAELNETHDQFVASI